MRSEDVRTLQLGPLWVLSALVGTHARFAEPDLGAFWDAVVSEGLRAPRDARDLLASLTTDRSGLLLDFELDGRSVVSGLRDVVTALGTRGSRRGLPPGAGPDRRRGRDRRAGRTGARSAPRT